MGSKTAGRLPAATMSLTDKVGALPYGGACLALTRSPRPLAAAGMYLVIVVS